MRKMISLFVAIALAASLSACARPMTICGVTYDSYGLANQDDKKNPEVQYEVVWGNVVWGALLFETVIAPIYFFGFSLFQPIGKKSTTKGAIGEPPGSCAMSTSNQTEPKS